MNYNIALLRGDGIGPEIVDSAVRVLEAVGKKFGHTFSFTPYLIGGAALDAVGVPLPEETVSVKVEEKVEEPKKLPAPAEVKADDSDTNIELKVVRPTSFEEVSTVADYLLAGCTVVLNLELLDMPQVMRMLDFLNGVTYTTGGDVKNVSQNTYIITPNGINIER